MILGDGEAGDARIRFVGVVQGHVKVATHVDGLLLFCDAAVAVEVAIRIEETGPCLFVVGIVQWRDDSLAGAWLKVKGVSWIGIVLSCSPGRAAKKDSSNVQLMAYTVDPDEKKANTSTSQCRSLKAKDEESIRSYNEQSQSKGYGKPDEPSHVAFP